MESTRYQERLTPDNAALLLIDHQVGLFTGVRDIPVAELKHNVVALAKALKVLSVPIIVTATSPEMWGPVIPELTEALPGISIINRTTVNAFDDARFAKAVEATGRSLRLGLATMPMRSSTHPALSAKPNASPACCEWSKLA